MQRDLGALEERMFDVLVIGAGAYGVAIAWDAAQRGLSVAIIDKNDIGGGTSFHNAKTLHGGIRALQQADVAQMRLYVRERRALMRIAPHLTVPIPFVIPTYRDFLHSRFVLSVGLALHNLASSDRNRGLTPSQRLQRGRVISRDECLQLNPSIDPSGVTGGALWYDCQMYNPDRITLSFLLSAAGAGACVANYVKATGFLGPRDRVEGVHAQDMLTGGSLAVKARVVVNAAGPWVPEVLRSAASSGVSFANTRLSKAMNLVVKADGRIGQYARGGLARGRFLFIVPWRGQAVVGTSHDPYEESTADQLHVTSGDLDRFLAEINHAFPRTPFAPADVLLVHRGLVPLAPHNEHGLRLLKESQIHDHRSDGIAGLLTVLGVRYTTARYSAERAVDRVFAMLGTTAPPCRTAVTPLAGGDIPDREAFLHAISQAAGPSLSLQTLERLAISYGSGYRRVLGQMEANAALSTPLSATCSVTHAEIQHAVRNEMAVKLSDAVLRRTEAGSAGHPGEPALEAAAAVMAADLGWNRQRIDGEIADVERFYRIETSVSVS